ncbi:radical SAM/CxCxxxxC motif protein YfkAB [Bacillus badius]|uniref:Thioredoxin-like oxidoreductase n=1 Tax=Bacillus badius TaxID=1455 RepID=A0ABR5AVZ3_BACBA|nr:radical SAM/CxCxxxxC motif protein YfkAB [Bacillus badius]KIL78926.1 Thioredoxin-like oxidoreductase [Bacillus badius]MED4715631.1 radical SAM/CxCxxxxC motif protein YfkAB [Bacillus badius]
MKQSISPAFDPWEAYLDVEQTGQMQLSNVEFTTTTLCNMRCAHCAVGYTLQTKDPEALPLEILIRRLDEVPALRALSITGGEPMLSKSSVREYVLPLLKYAHERNVYTQLNSNLTLELSRYEEIAPYLDVLHISHNWGTTEEFAEVGFANMARKPSFQQREALFQRMIDNSKALSRMGVMVSAETMLNKSTLPYLEKIHRQVVEEMECARHEIHPMYPSDFASALESLSLDRIREAIHRLLDVRDQHVWMLFGTLPFYACSADEQTQKLLKRLRGEKNVTVRNDPDGRSRLNINIFTGEIIVTDFGDAPPLGNIQTTALQEAYETWNQSRLAAQLNCHCANVQCLGPNILVKNAYYKNISFTDKAAMLVK